MIPSILSRQIHQGLKDFLATTFQSTNPFFHGVLEKFLSTDGSLNKGPYISLQLPFEKGGDQEYFPHVPLGYTPYRHQEKAFARLSGPKPRGTLIATGTGSGKTECYNQPILEYCRVNSGTPGIKAILLYPMNALAFDQASRLAATIWKNPGLRGRVTAGLFVGQSTADPSSTMGEDHIITDKDLLRQSPPDILLTNYKMLDYLLLRARDAALWAANTPETLRYIVVDELHTFDGAQGTDLACLLRRLQSRLGTPAGYLCPIGTSATLGGDDSTDQLIRYAGKIFGQDFDHEALITESRLNADDFLRGELISRVDIPAPRDMDALKPEKYDTPRDFLQAQIQLWTGLDLQAEPDKSQWRVDLGQALKSHVFVHNLLRVVDGQVRSMQHILDELGGKASPQVKSGGPEYASLLLSSLLACISTAKSLDQEELRPFIHVRVQHWYRELRRMVCSVGSSPEIRFSDDLTQDQRNRHLPLLHCRECGQMGWLGRLPLHGAGLQSDLKAIYVDFFSKKPSQRLTSIFPQEQGSRSSFFPGHSMQLCPWCLHLGNKSGDECRGCGQTGTIAVLVPESAVKHCPSCGAHNSLTLLGSRAASLTSVMIGQFMSSSYNFDPKCIAFSDNVQDAAHRAGFFGARTFRFTFRAALQQYVQDRAEGHSLQRISREMPAYMQSRMDAENFAATFMPSNMTWLHDAEHLEKHDCLPSGSDLGSLIARRLRFETVSEYGFSSRIGRTLEKSGASVARPDPERMGLVIEELKMILQNEMEELRMLQGTAGNSGDTSGQSINNNALASFLMGLTVQIKNQGGIFDPDLEEYVKNWGKEYYISQRRKHWMPGFGPKTRTPGFVTTRAGMDRFPQITHSGSRNSWYEWWAFNYFPNLAMRQPGLAQRFYNLVFASLNKHGLVQDRFQDGHHIYGLQPDALLITNQVQQFRCSICGFSLSGAAADHEVWSSMSCLRRGCQGIFDPAERGADYYGRLYIRGRINRVVAREHTGLLDRDTREELEQKFKTPDAQRKPWYPNLLSSTPTLEMGIDIGSLSATLQCSVPPGQANYVQRTGRSGRKDGNALNLTVAAGQAHDLYFFARPLEMISGYVHPPGVYLDASAVLERQFTAFCLDRWVQASPGTDPVPSRLSTVLDTFQRQDRQVFPHNFMEYIQTRQTRLFDDFAGLFHQELSQDSINHLKQFVFGDSQEHPGLGYRILLRLYDLQKERKGLKTQVDRLYREIKRRENSPVRDKNHEDEMDSLRQERSGLMALIRNINSRDTYNFLTDEGLLPNYAFPEQGILLQSIIYRRRKIQQKGQGRYETLNFEYERPASSGLRELAPGNRFYAEGRRVEVDQVDLRTAGLETWRLCSNCPHCEPEARAGGSAVCPRCASPMWTDQGRKQELVRVRQVMANAPDWDSRITDESDQRDPAFYSTQLLVDVDNAAIRDAYQIEHPQHPFGFEFISRAVFRDINFGPQGQNSRSMQVAGEDLEGAGFVLCRHCGKVQKRDGRIKHAFGCPAKDKDSEANFVKSVFLYREFTSEAIKILVPVTGIEASKKRLDSFVAALQLGLRHHFGGSAYAIDHLQTTLSQEPVPDSSLRKQYLVLYDTVPGGTGFLKQLMRSETMLTVLEKAMQALTNCSCHKDPDRDGCYNCLLAYRHSYLMPTTSRQTAQEVLSTILSHRDTLRQVDNLQQIRVEGLGESELEVLFLEGLQSLDRQGWTVELRKEVIRGKPGRFLRLRAQAYEVEPQVELGQAQAVVIPSRADFVIRSARSRQAGRPVAVYADGLAFHRQRMGQDMAQRMALVQSGRFHTWSLTWKDIHGQVRQRQEKVADLLHPGDSPMGRQKFVQLLSQLDLEGCRELHTRDNFSLLAHFLADLREKDMQNYALAQAVSLLDMSASQDARHEWLQAVGHMVPDILLQELDARVHESLIGSLNPGPVNLFVLASRNALKSADPSGVRLFCCLDDTEEAQEKTGFERSWINFLRLYNIFQFLPRAFFCTRQGLRQGMYDQLIESFSDQDAGASHASVAREEDPEWQEAFELAGPELHERLSQMRSQGWPAPEVGFELHAGGRVLAEAELAWPEHKIACLTHEQKKDAEILQEHGWTVYTLDE